VIGQFTFTIMLNVELKVTLKVIFLILISISLVQLMYLVPEILPIVFSFIWKIEEIKIACIAQKLFTQNLHFFLQ